MTGGFYFCSEPMRATILVTALILLAGSCKSPEPVAAVRRPGWATKVEAKRLSNLYKIDEELYRCEQPSAAAMRELQERGVKTVLNLRRVKSDPKPREAQLKWVHVRINTWTISYDDVLKALIEIGKAEKPVAVHCKHGSDRTGCVVAAWCLVKHNCSKEQVIEELRHGGYHFHERYFKNIIRLVESLDVEKLKSDLRKWEEKSAVKNS
jgi:tyrosine-protein phosphatase SIW14